jgi:UDP-N-acetylglucosamine diphosphorylase/glucosamine-1-phosphate N-acetyltransferase
MITIILAGGLGKRMNSGLPKVLHMVNDKPMIYYAIRNAVHLRSSRILVVVGRYKTIIQEEIQKYYSQIPDIIEYIDQSDAKGTGHAIQCCIPYITNNQISADTDVLILSGDVPLIKLQTLNELMLKHNNILITKSPDPHGCGRILFKNGTIQKIVEEKDCTAEERKIQFINCGVYNLTVETLLNTIPFIQNNNAASEYYLTDFIELAVKKSIQINHYELLKTEQYQVINVNTAEDLLSANEILWTGVMLE